MNLKSCSMTVGMSQSTGLRRKDARGKEEMSQSTLRDSEREREREKEREREREGKFLAWSSLLLPH